MPQNPKTTVESSPNVSENDNEPSKAAKRVESVDSYLTLTGTIKRNKKAGQKETDVQVTIRKEDLGILDTNSGDVDIPSDNHKCQISEIFLGVLTFLWTILCIPFVFIISFLYSFFMGTITWYNVFSLYSEEKSFFYRISVSPLLLLIYPLYIITCSIGLGVYSAAVQILCNFNMWWKEVQDLEKGFYGWLCRLLSVEDCCPYQLVILTEVRESLPQSV